MNSWVPRRGCKWIHTIYEFREFIHEFPMNSLNSYMNSLNSYMNSWKIMKSWIHLWIHKKNIWFQWYQDGFAYHRSVWIHIHEFIHKFIFTCLNSTMNSYIKQIWWITQIHIRISVSTQNVNAYMNLFTNIHNMAIRVLRRSLAGCSSPNNDAGFGFGAAAVASHWVRVSEAAASHWVTDSVTRVTLAAVSEWGSGGWWTAGRG